MNKRSINFIINQMMQQIELCLFCVLNKRLLGWGGKCVT